MYHAIFPDGRISCARYEHVEQGVTLHASDGSFIAFVPYDNLHAIVDQEGFESEETPPFVA